MGPRLPARFRSPCCSSWIPIEFDGISLSGRRLVSGAIRRAAARRSSAPPRPGNHNINSKETHWIGEKYEVGTGALAGRSAAGGFDHLKALIALARTSGERKCPPAGAEPLLAGGPGHSAEAMRSGWKGAARARESRRPLPGPHLRRCQPAPRGQRAPGAGRGAPWRRWQRRSSRATSGGAEASP